MPGFVQNSMSFPVFLLHLLISAFIQDSGAVFRNSALNPVFPDMWEPCYKPVYVVRTDGRGRERGRTRTEAKLEVSLRRPPGGDLKI
jgi:hypothetical protein